MKTTNMTGITCSGMPFAQITMPTLAPVGDGFQGTGVSTSVLGGSARDRAFVAAGADVIHYPSTDKFANGVSRSAPDRPPA